MDERQHAVMIPSVRRPQILHETLQSVCRSTPIPAAIVVVVHADADYLPESSNLPHVKIIKGRLGAAAQRNDGIDAIPAGMKLVTFLDDDVELATDYLEQVRKAMTAHPDISVLMGKLLKDGDISREEAIQLIRSEEGKSRSDNLESPFAAYGCNMTLLLSTLQKTRFDERMKGYAWLEDAEFGYRCEKVGRSARIDGAIGVHMRVQSGRVSDVEFGFVQIMSSTYMYTKGHFSFWHLFRRFIFAGLRNNMVKWMLRDKSVDRWSRLKGNFIAIGLLMRGRVEPEYVESLKRYRTVPAKN